MAKKLTYEEVKKFIELESDSGCKLLSSEYINNITKLKILCHCGHGFETTYSSFKNANKRQCNNCSKNNMEYRSPKTHEVYVQEVCELVGDGFTVIGKYIGSRDKVEIRHNKCRRIFDVQASNFLSIPTCPYCSREKQYIKSRRTNEEFVKEVHDLVGDEYIFLEKYQISTTKISCKHNACGHIYSVTPHAFLIGSRCPKCSKKSVSTKLALTQDEFVERFDKRSKGEYELLSHYVNATAKIKVKHNACGREYDVLPNGFINGNSCSECMMKSYGWRKIPLEGKKRKTHEEFIAEVKELVGEEYTILSKYEKYNKHVKIKHNTCDHIYKVTPNNFIGNNRRCPVCAGSHGERKIANYLERKNVPFEKEYEFEDCRYKRPLKFDFAVFNPNNSIDYLIEFDGEQHFKVVDYFGGERGYHKRRYKDGIKDDYCRKNKIKLIRISYTEIDNINEILEKCL